MKKKLLSILLCLVMCLSLVPTAIYAGGIDADEIMASHVCSRTNKEHCVVMNDYGAAAWYEYDSAAGVWTRSSKTNSISGVGDPAIGTVLYQAAHGLQPCETVPAEPTPITKIAISGVQTPIIGQPTDTSGITITTTPADAFNIEYIFWFNSEDWTQNDTTFLANRTYYLDMRLSPKEGYCFQFDSNGDYIGEATCDGQAAYDAGRSNNTENLFMRYGPFTSVDDPAIDYNVCVSGVWVTSANKDDVLGDGTVSYNPDAKTLTLDGAKLTDAGSQWPVIYADDALAVNVVGDSTINSNSNEGIYSELDLTLTGSANLDITVVDDSGDGIWSDDGDITIDMSGNLTIDAADEGIHAEGSVMISGKGDVTINSGDCGIFLDSGALEISGSGDVTITSQQGLGIDSCYDVVLSGSGKVTVISESGVAVSLYDPESQLLLNGTGSPITLKSGEGFTAVGRYDSNQYPGGEPIVFKSALVAVNADDGNDTEPAEIPLVAGTNLAYYNKVTGAPDTALVVYEHIDYYTVSFDMNGNGKAPADQKVAGGDTAAKPADPSAEGYTFGGWYADAACKTAFDFNSAINADTTVYAKWTKNAAEPTEPANPDAPQTGDSSNMMLWTMLAVCSGVALCGAVVLSKKRKHN